MNQSVAPVGPGSERTPPGGPPVRETQQLADRREPVGEAIGEADLRAIHLRGDAWMARFIAFHLLVAVALAPFHGTWSAAAVLGGGAALAFLFCRLLWPARLVTRIVAGIALQAFVVLHVYQMAGLAEMHFFFFTAVTAMIIYQDWRAPWPGVLAIIAQHSVFHHLHNQGVYPGGLPFFEPETVGALRMSFHYGIAVTQVAIASYWAHVLRQQTLREATQRAASSRANTLLQEQQVKLATANDYLSEQALRLEKAYAEIRESEIRFRSTFDQAAVGVAHVGLNGEWLRVNDRLCEITGYSRCELLDLTFQAITHAEDLESDLDRLRRLLAGEIQSYSMEKRYIRKDAQPVWINLTVSLVRDGDGEPAYFVSIIEDIDLRRQAEAERDRLYSLEAESRQVAEAANQAKSQFLATMSHELRTPLNAISGYVELLEMGIHGPVNEQQARSLGRVRSAGQYLLSLINDILNFARIESGRIDIFPVSVSVARLLSDVEPLVAPQMARNGLEMVLELPEPEIAVHVDPEKAQQILLNLLGNAIKFTPAGGMVRLDARSVDETVRVRVADNGCGIADDRLDHIFEPFVQVDRHLTPESQQGIGLGLSISRELARAMGGDLSVESVPGEGSVFSVSFPLRLSGRADPPADGQGFIEIPMIAHDRQI